MPVDPTKRFSTRVPYYVRSRPGYPPALLEFFRSEFSLQPEHAIADVGSGTGILSQLFLENGNTVFCVEPNTEMRAAGTTQLAKYPNYREVDGTAEATTLAARSIDFVTAGQAFHWFDPHKSAAEFRRILKPGGWAALIWNERRAVNTGFNAAYDQFIDRYSGDRATSRIRGGSVGATPAVERFFGQSRYDLRGFANHQDLNWDGLLDRVYSSSYMPLPDDPVNAEMTAELRGMFEKFAVNNVIRIEYETRLYYGNL
jgi:SAM-dependent methyltransferase